MTAYRPGLHLLSTFTSSTDSLTDMAGCRTAFDQLIEKLGLTKVGEAYCTMLFLMAVSQLYSA